MTRRAFLPLIALLAAALVPAGPAIAKSHKKKGPVVKSISPLRVQVGQKLYIRGAGFRPGKGKTRVFFVRVHGKGVASAPADSGTRSKVVVTVPAALNSIVGSKPARFRLRVLAGRFGDWTKAAKSPVVSATPSGPTSGGTSSPTGDCDGDGIPNATDTDDDNDLLPDTVEAQIGTDSCKADTDGDGVDDGFEWQSALDFNRTVLFGSRPPTPYPAKRPYPNPLYPDANQDYDGDGLTMADESLLWDKFGGHKFPLNYSDGLQSTVPTPAPTQDVLQQLDTASGGPHFHDGWLDDGERDADGDGLSNWDEAHGRMTADWWAQYYDGKAPSRPKETPSPWVPAGTDMADPDTDGDGIPDGADDQDHDGLSNQFEVERPYNWQTTYASAAHPGSNAWARVNPFNPCKPVYSETCPTHVPFGYYSDDEDWIGLSVADAVALSGPPGATPGPYWP